jgi:hypothetical protein
MEIRHRDYLITPGAREGVHDEEVERSPTEFLADAQAAEAKPDSAETELGVRCLKRLLRRKSASAEANRREGGRFDTKQERRPRRIASGA